MLASILGWFFLSLALAGAAYTLLAAYFAERFAKRPVAAAKTFPAVTILKPLHGDEPALEENLATFFHQDYPGPVQIVFGVADANDPAAAVVERLRRRFPDKDAVQVVGTRRHGANPKISNLIGMMTAAKHAVLVLSDSDIAVTPEYLSTVTAALEPEDVGAATCVYTGWDALPSFAARLTAMGVNYQFLPNVLSGLGLGLTRPCFGSTIAIKAAVLKEIGGFDAFANILADDYEIGRAVRAKGYRVVIPAFAVRHACGEANLGEWFRHELRWLRTIRTVDPAGHWGSTVTHAFPLALVGAILLGFPAFSLAVVAAALVARGLLKWQIDSTFGVFPEPYGLLPLRDVLSFGVFLTSLFGGAVVWQDEALHVGGDGVLDKVR